VRPDLIRRAVRRLEALSQAERPEDLNIPGFNFHRLSGPLAASFSLHLNGPWCITFEWRDGDAINVDLVNYH
jgi:proteic killer suppression protein